MCGSVDAGGHNRYPHYTFKLVIKGRSENNRGVGVNFLADAIGRFINLKQCHIHAAGDIDQNGMCTFHRGVVKQRIIDRRLGRLCGAAFAAGFASAHHGLAHFAHHCANICKIQIDQPGLDHQIGDAADALMQYRVGDMKRIGKGGAFIRQTEQVLIWDDDQRVNIGLQFFNATLGLFHAALAFKFKRLGDHPNSQNAALAGGSGNHWCGSGAGATTHAGGNKDHVAIGQFSHDFLQAFFGGGTANFWF